MPSQFALNQCYMTDSPPISPIPKSLYNKSLPITNFFYIVLQKSNFSPRFCRAQMQLTKFSELKLFTHQEKILLLLICSADHIQKLNFELTNLSINNYLHKLSLQFYKIVLPTLSITLSNTKKYNLTKNKILILFLQIMAQIKFQYVSMTKVTTSLLNFWTRFHSNKLHLFNQNSKLPLKSQ